jgi:hypothetical protein
MLPKLQNDLPHPLCLPTEVRQELLGLKKELAAWEERLDKMIYDLTGSGNKATPVADDGKGTTPENLQKGGGHSQPAC